MVLIFLWVWTKLQGMSAQAVVAIRIYCRKHLSKSAFGQICRQMFHTSSAGHSIALTNLNL